MTTGQTSQASALPRMVEILLVEDNPGDVRLTAEALKRSALPTTLHVVEDGEQAIEFLRRRGRYARAPRPDLILLDVNLPAMDGHEVLAQIKPDLLLRTIPVVMLTSSDTEKDIQTAYELHANSYVVKPPTAAKLVQVIKGIEDYWLGIVALPPRPNE